MLCACPHHLGARGASLQDLSSLLELAVLNAKVVIRPPTHTHTRVVKSAEITNRGAEIIDVRICD